VRCPSASREGGMVEGWLIKRAGGRAEVSEDGSGKRGCGSIGELRRKWEYRFFVVLRAKLNYYRSPEAYQQGVAPSGSINLRNASMWEYEREEEKLKGRVHKFVIVTPDRLYYMCAETRDDLEMWFEGVASVICQAMRAWSPAEVGTWLAMNRLGHLSDGFQSEGVTGMRLSTMDCEEGLEPVKALVQSDEDRAKLISVLQMVNRSGPGHAGLAGSSPTKEESVSARMRDAGAGATFDIFLCFRPSAAALATQFVEMLPATADGAPWNVFMGDGEPQEGESDEAAVERHEKALMGTPNFIVLCTPGFFTTMENTEGTSDIQHMMLANAMKMSSSMNTLVVYTSDFKIPKPGKLPEALRPLVKYDFHKLDMDSEVSRDVCVNSIHFDIMSDRKEALEPGAMKTEWGSVGMAVQAFNDTDPSQVERQGQIVEGFQVISTTLDGERQFYEVRRGRVACLSAGSVGIARSLHKAVRTGLPHPTRCCVVPRSALLCCSITGWRPLLPASVTTRTRRRIHVQSQTSGC
jgi:hypothetical protein